jgi:hypothetical protein
MMDRGLISEFERSLSIYPKLGTSLVKICLLAIEYITLIPCATSLIRVRHIDCYSLVRRDSAG